MGKRCRVASFFLLLFFAFGPCFAAQPEAIKDKPGAHTFDDFLIMNGPYRGYIVKLLARGLWAKIRPPAN